MYFQILCSTNQPLISLFQIQAHSDIPTQNNSHALLHTEKKVYYSVKRGEIEVEGEKGQSEMEIRSVCFCAMR